MTSIAILILSDGKPGHYHLADGVAAAIGRRRGVDVRRIDVRRRKVAPARVQAAALRAGVSPATVLRLAYGLSSHALAPAQVVISAGGDTLGATVAAARLLGARSIFCGTLRHFAPDDLSLVVSSYERHRHLPRHLVTLKPNGLDPDTLPPRTIRPGGSPDAPPRMAGLLIGGDSGLFMYHDADWTKLLSFIEASHAAHATRWIVSTSRRTPDRVGDRLQALAARSPAIARFIDFRVAGPGTLPEVFAGVEAILATEDSSTMMSEAVCARLPVVGVAPASHDFKDEEREYRALMLREGWVASLALADLEPASFVAALGGLTPLAANHLDALAAALAERLPDLFTDPAGPLPAELPF